MIIQLTNQWTGASWPSLNSSTLNLLGLFPDLPNIITSTTLSVHSRAMFKAAILLSQQYNITIQNQLIGGQTIQTGGDAITALAGACQFISTSNIAGIVGPAFSREAYFIAPFAEKNAIPVVSYSATDSQLSDRNAYPTFYRTVPSDNAAALAVTELFIQFNWTSCIIVYQNDEYGSGGVKAISETFNQNNLTVTQIIQFDTSTLNIRGDLKSLLTNSVTCIVIVWAELAYTSLILQKALVLDVLGPRFTWILSANVPLNTFNKTVYDKLSGILTIEPVVGNIVNVPINTTLLNAAYKIWEQYEPETFPGSNNVNYYALFAFDATWLLIKTLQQLCSLITNTSSPCLSFNNAPVCFEHRLLNSDSYFDMMNNTTFLGVSGTIGFVSNTTDRMTDNYYMLKNIQRSVANLTYVPVLVWSNLNEWTTYTLPNVIIWPGQSLVVPTGYASVVGVTLRIAVIETQPFTMITKIVDASGQTTTKLIGYVPDLIEKLRIQLGFIANITLFSTNQSYNELVDAVANGSFDMVIGDVTITAARRQKVAFSNSIFDNSLRIIIRKVSSPQLDLWSYLRPFSLNLWLTLLAATIVSSILICIVEQQQNEALQERSITSLFALSVWYSSGAILGNDVDFHVTTAAGRLITLGLYILSLILVAAYTANLTSDLTLSKSKDIISGIDDIKNGKIAYSRIGIRTHSSIEDYYIREISRGSRNFYPLSSVDDAFRALLDNIIDASIADAGIVEYATSSIYCNLTLVGTDFDNSAYGIVFQKNWLYEQDLDVGILSIREAGGFDALKVKWFQSSTCSDSSTTSTAMSIESMVGLFLTFAIISILAILLFIWNKRFHIKDYVLILIKKKNFPTV